MKIKDFGLGSYVVVRTYSAGVHAGILAKRKGKEVVLYDARRIWSWTSANNTDGALSGVANHGVGPDSKIAGPVKSILLTEAVEVITATESARKSIEGSKWNP